MADDVGVKHEFNDSHLDQSLLDPRLRSDTPDMNRKDYQAESSTPGLIPGPTLISGAAPVPATTTTQLTPTRDGLCDFNIDDIDRRLGGDQGLPPSAFQSLEFMVGYDHMIHDEAERLWLIGVQAGIGLGITGAREAVLNEMMYENTVFSRPIQSSPSDLSPYDMRMHLGRLCMEGFDRRVADTIAKSLVANSIRLIDIIVADGLTACLPEYGSPLPGTFAFFTDNDSARCHENSRNLDRALGIADGQLPPAPGVSDGIGAGQPAPLTAAFRTDSRFIGGIDMMKLTGTAGLVANALNRKTSVGYGGPLMFDQQSMARGPEPYPDHLAGGAHLDGHPGNDHQGHKAKDEGVYQGRKANNGRKVSNRKPAVQPKAQKASTQGTKRATRQANGRRIKQAILEPRYRSSSPDEDHISIPDTSSRPRPTLVETKSGRAVIRTVRQNRKK